MTKLSRAEFVASTPQLPAPDPAAFDPAPILPTPQLPPPQLPPPELPVLSKQSAKKARKRAREALEREEKVVLQQSPAKKVKKETKKVEKGAPATLEERESTLEQRPEAQQLPPASFACKAAGKCMQPTCKLGHPNSKKKGTTAVRVAEWCAMARECNAATCEAAHPNKKGSWDGSEEDSFRIRELEEEMARRKQVEKATKLDKGRLRGGDESQDTPEEIIRPVAKVKQESTKKPATQQVVVKRTKSKTQEAVQRAAPKRTEKRKEGAAQQVAVGRPKRDAASLLQTKRTKEEDVASLRAAERTKEKDAPPHIEAERTEKEDVLHLAARRMERMDATPRFAAERMVITTVERRGAEELGRSPEKRDRRVEACPVVLTEADRLEAEMRASGKLAGIRKELTSSHRHTWTDPSFGPVDWEDE